MLLRVLGLGPKPYFLNLVAEWIHFTLLGDNITHYKTKSVHFWGLKNLAATSEHWSALLLLFLGGDLFPKGAIMKNSL